MDSRINYATSKLKKNSKGVDQEWNLRKEKPNILIHRNREDDRG